MSLFFASSCAPPEEAVPPVEISDVLPLSEVVQLEQGMPLLVVTTTEGVEPRTLKAFYNGIINNPETGLTSFVASTDPRDSHWPIGGAAQGMSGSPVLAQHQGRWRPIGALSFHFKGLPADSDGSALLGITPAETMLAVDPIHTASAEQPLGVSSAEMTTLLLPPSSGGMGISEGASLSAESVDGSGEEFQLVPGAPLAVHLIKGAVTLNAVGTVSFLDSVEKKLWAFGHPFSKGGRVSLPFSGAAVSGFNLDDKNGPYQVVFPVGPSLGAITADYLPAIAGIIGQSADTIPFSFGLKIGDGQEKEFISEIANTPPSFSLLTPPVLSCVAIKIPFEASLGAVLEGSAEYEIKLRFAESNLVAERGGMISSASDIVSQTCLVTAGATAFFYGGTKGLDGEGNNFEATIASIDFRTGVFPEERREVTTIRVEPVQKAIQAGGQLDVVVTLHRFNTPDEEVVTVTVPVPSDCAPGSAKIKAGELFVDADDDKKKGPWTLEEAIEKFNKTPRSDHLRVRLTCADPKCANADACDPCSGGIQDSCVTCNEDLCPDMVAAKVAASLPVGAVVLETASAEVKIE